MYHRFLITLAAAARLTETATGHTLARRRTQDPPGWLGRVYALPPLQEHVLGVPGPTFEVDVQNAYLSGARSTAALLYL